MQSPAPSLEPRSSAAQASNRWGWTLIAVGGAVVLWGVLYMTSSTVGGRVQDFAHRRTYNETKTAMHAAFPGFLWRSALGLALFLLGTHLRTKASSTARE